MNERICACARECIEGTTGEHDREMQRAEKGERERGKRRQRGGKEAGVTEKGKRKERRPSVLHI